MSATATVMTTSASAMAKSLRRVRRSTTTSTTVDEADRHGRHVRPAGMHEEVRRLEHLVVVAAGEAGERPELRQQDGHPDAGHEPDHHRVGDEPDQPAGLEQAEDQHDGAGEHRQGEQAGHALLRRERGQRAARREAQRRGRDDRHALGAGRERPRRRAGRDGVQAVDRRHAGQHGVRHGVADLGGPDGDTRDHVVQQVACAREAGERLSRPLRAPRRGSGCHAPDGASPAPAYALCRTSATSGRVNHSGSFLPLARYSSRTCVPEMDETRAPYGTSLRST